MNSLTVRAITTDAEINRHVAEAWAELVEAGQETADPMSYVLHLRNQRNYFKAKRDEKDN